MPKLRSETIGTGDQSWLGSTHALRNARTVLVDISAFTAGTHYPNGYIPSGFPIAIVGNMAVPYDPTVGVTTGAGVLAGHLLTDQPVVSQVDFAAPLFDHGRVKAAKVAALALAAFVKPTVAAKNGVPTIIYI